MSLIRKLSAIWKQWLTLILYELTCTCTCTCIWLNYFICTLTSPTLGTFTEMVINLIPTTKQCISENSKKLTWSIDNKVKCNTDNFMQYGWVWTETIQQLKWLIITALATDVVLCLICFINVPLPHPYLGIFAEMTINQKLRHEVKQCGSVKCNSHISFCKIMGTDKSQQKIFNYQKLKIDFNMCNLISWYYWFASFVPWHHTHWKTFYFYRNGYQPETKQQKSCIPEK